MAIEARNRPLPDWFVRIRTRQTVLPRFQRYEAWNSGRVTELFTTVLQDLPIGAGLVLEIGDSEPFVSRTLAGAPEKGERVTEHLLDGQQRLTALWRGLHNNYEDRTYFLRLAPDEETGLPYSVEAVPRWKRDGDKERRPFWANSATETWQRGLVPLDLCAPDITATQRFREWARIAIPDAGERDAAADQVAVVRQKFHAFNLPFLSLPVGTKKETALDVFIKMNTSAEPLSIYDVVVAQVEASEGHSLHDLVADVKRECPSIEAYYPPEDLTLAASALLQGRSANNSTYIASEFGAALLANWDRFLVGVRRTVDFLEQERVFDAARLPTDVVVPVLVALWGLAPAGLDAEGRARVLFRKYLWRAFFTDRYEKSTSTRSLEDFLALKALMTGASSAATPPIFDEAAHPLPTQEEIIGAGWPKQRDRLARAVLALALRHGGHDLADGGAATRENLRKREYHHLFPDAHLTKLGTPGGKIYRSLNCALVTWRTNRKISDKDPERYLTERQEGATLGEAEVRARLGTHLIPYGEMVKNDYDAFLHARAELVSAAMTKLCATGGA